MTGSGGAGEADTGQAGFTVEAMGGDSWLAGG